MISSEIGFNEEAALTLRRLRPRLEVRLSSDVDAPLFLERLERGFPRLFRLLYTLYGAQYDFFYHIETMLYAAADGFLVRPPELRSLDAIREEKPDWFQSEQMIGAVGYVDLFAGTLQGAQARIPYFQELGLTYLHLMPLYRAPEDHNDGGYAVSNFREVNPALGTMADLVQLTRILRTHGISLVLDFVFNHTSDEHEWAQKALSGDKTYQSYYRMFVDRTLPDQYEQQLREIFPEQAPGNFTYRHELEKWVWTTFYPFQWDLNYANPELFTAMLGEMIFLANQGVEVLRLDAVPFIWKQLGTNCENLPETHLIIQAYNALIQIACPALLFKSEAIVHPRDVRSYIRTDECPLSYNPIMMVALWDALATRKVNFFTHTMQKQFPLMGNTAWLNYIRSHDDIGWGFADEDANELGIYGPDHRRFLNTFYTGKFEGSFANGLPFNYNPKNGDMRISGTAASLAGLEQAVYLGDDALLEHAIRRLLLMFSVCLSVGGIPLLYLGDELGTVNDFSYLEDPSKRADNRWVHRPFTNPAHMEARHDPTTVSGRIFQPLKRLIETRKSMPVLADGETSFVDSGNPHVLAYTRHNQFLALVNFSDFPQKVDFGLFTQDAHLIDAVSGSTVPNGLITLDSYQFHWLITDDVANKHFNAG